MSRATKTRRTEEQKLLEALKLSKNAAAKGFTEQRQQEREFVRVFPLLTSLVRPVKTTAFLLFTSLLPLKLLCSYPS